MSEIHMKVTTHLGRSLRYSTQTVLKGRFTDMNAYFTKTRRRHVWLSILAITASQEVVQLG
jgi:hypothetical protein